MYSINQIGEIASGLMLYEFDYISTGNKQYEMLIASGTISGKLGELNTLLNQSFHYTGSDGNPYPRLQQEEQAILEQLYIQEYNTKQAQKLLRGVYDAGDSSNIEIAATDWVELREGDTVIKRNAASIANSASTRITLSKDFKALADDAARKIKELVYAYNMYGAQPRQVNYNDCGDTSAVAGEYIQGMPGFNFIAMTTLCEDAPGGSTTLIPCDQEIFQIGDEVIIAYGTPYQEPGNVIGFGSIVMASPTNYFHAKGTTVHIIKRNPPDGGSGPTDGGSGLIDSQADFTLDPSQGDDQITII